MSIAYGFPFPTFIIYNPKSNSVYLRKSLFRVNFDHLIVGVL